MLGAAIIARTGREGRESRFATLLPTADLVKPQLSLFLFLARVKRMPNHTTHTHCPPSLDPWEVGVWNTVPIFILRNISAPNSATLATARKIILCEARSVYVCNSVCVESGRGKHRSLSVHLDHHHTHCHDCSSSIHGRAPSLFRRQYQKIKKVQRGKGRSQARETQKARTRGGRG